MFRLSLLARSLFELIWRVAPFRSLESGRSSHTKAREMYRRQLSCKLRLRALLSISLERAKAAGLPGAPTAAAGLAQKELMGCAAQTKEFDPSISGGETILCLRVFKFA